MENTKKINEKITSYRVILIDNDGKNIGEVIKVAAVERARQSGLDLVEVGNKNGMPICKMINYNKMKYEKEKSEKHQAHPKIPKQIKFKYKTDVNDLNRKIEHVKEFLQDGHKVILIMTMEGREKGMPECKVKFEEVMKRIDEQKTTSDISFADRSYSTSFNPH